MRYALPGASPGAHWFLLAGCCWGLPPLVAPDVPTEGIRLTGVMLTFLPYSFCKFSAQNGQAMTS
jgi:hypothetical protein